MKLNKNVILKLPEQLFFFTGEKFDLSAKAAVFLTPSVSTECDADSLSECMTGFSILLCVLLWWLSLLMSSSFREQQNGPVFLRDCHGLFDWLVK